MGHPHIPGLSDWRPLARGGLAVVWEARQQSLDRLVAVKVYQRQLDEGDQPHFWREAAAAGRLPGHPGIVTAYDAGLLPDDRPYIILQLCPGGSLTQWLKPENRPSDERVRQDGVRIADALAAVHASGLLHRDVKPANILIDSYGNPRLADFGLSAVIGTESAAAAAPRVTPAYAPPEAFEMQPATESGDVYSLGATFYALLAGRPPRDMGGAVTFEHMVEIAKRPISPLPGVNWYLMDVLMTALSNDPSARPTAAKFRDQLANVPAPQYSKRGLHLVMAGDTSSVSPREPAVVPLQPAISNGDSTAVAALTADTERAHGQVEALEARPRRGRRRAGALALAAAVVTVIASVTAPVLNEPASTVASPAITQSATPGTVSASGGQPPASDPNAGAIIQVEDPAAAKPFQTVRILGAYQGGAETLLRIERWEAGKWLAFPLPAKTDESGQFTAFVELEKPGRYRLRVLDPGTGVASKPSELVIMG
jgi:hypothetical protein